MDPNKTTQEIQLLMVLPRGGSTHTQFSQTKIDNSHLRRSWRVAVFNTTMVTVAKRMDCLFCLVSISLLLFFYSRT